MLKKLLIIKTGATYPAIRDNLGDFEDMIMGQIGLSQHEVCTVPVFEEKPLPTVDKIAGIIITGSHAMVTDRAAWSVYTANWLRSIANSGIPTLGICYGHQLLADAYGGIVDYHPQGAEIGTTGIRLSETGSRDKLFEVLPPSFLSHVWHAQAVIKLPKGAVVLAHNAFEPHQGVLFHKNVWGVQFHPEFSAEVLRMYLTEVQKSGSNMAAIEKTVQETPCGKTFLRRFMDLV